MRLNKNKIEESLIKYGFSNKRSKKVAIFLVGENLFDDKNIVEVINEKSKIKKIIEIREE